MASTTTAVGSAALSALSSGTDNTALGAEALTDNSSGSENVAVGSQAGKNSVSGSENVIIGYDSAPTLTSGSSNIVIGAAADVPTSSTSNYLNIGGVITGNMFTGAVTLADGFMATTQAALDSSTKLATTAYVDDAVSAGGGATSLAGLSDVIYNLTSNNMNLGSGTAFASGASGNLYIGQGAGNPSGSTSTTYDNVGVGYTALGAVTSGTGNTAIGYEALVSLTSGGSNIAVGQVAGSQIQNSDYNILIGNAAGGSIGSGGDCNVFIGQLSGGNNGSPLPLPLQYNVGIGYQALANLGSAWGNVAIGYNAMMRGNPSSTSVQSYCTAVGYQAMLGNATYSISGTNNTAIGSSALANVSSDSFTVAIGDGALSVQAGGTGYNTAVGSNVGASVTSGAQNTLCGYEAGTAGTALTSGENNTLIGYEAQVNSATASNRTALGSGAISTADNSMQFGNSSITSIYLGATAGGTIYGIATSITSVSDCRLKKDITDLGLGLDFIKKLRPVSYRHTKGEDNLRYGLIAQEVEAALDNNTRDLIESHPSKKGLALVERESDEMGTYRMNYGELLAPLIKAVQELNTKCLKLEETVSIQQAQIDALTNFGTSARRAAGDKAA
jgi:hypothetical protein